MLGEILVRGQEFLRSVTEKGQVTIPVEIRRKLGIEPRDRVSFHVEKDRVYLTVEETVESVYGAVSPRQRPEDFQALRDVAFEEHVRETIKEMGARDEVP